MLDSLEYDTRRALVLVRLSGQFAAEDYRRALEEIGGDDIPRNAHSIWDLRELDFSSVDWKRLKEMKMVREDASPRRPDTRSAAIVSGPIERSLIVLFLDISADDRTPPRVCYTMAEAERWCMTGSEPDPD